MQRLEAEHEDVLAVGERLVLQNRLFIQRERISLNVRVTIGAYKDWSHRVAGMKFHEIPVQGLVLQYAARAGDFKSVFLYVESQPEKVFFSVQLDEGNVKIVIRMLLMKLHRKQMPVQRRPFPVVPVPEHAFLPVHRDFVVAAQEQ